MKARDITKQMAWDRGFNIYPKIEDGIQYGDSNRNFTEGQAIKLTEAFDKLRLSIGTRWGIPGVVPAKKTKKTR